MAELVDAQVSGICGSNVVEVRVFFWAPPNKNAPLWGVFVRYYVQTDSEVPEVEVHDRVRFDHWLPKAICPGRHAAQMRRFVVGHLPQASL